MPKGSDLPGIGEKLRQARESAGLSQAQVADLMNLHRPTVTEIENESRKVSAGELKQFARRIGQRSCDQGLSRRHSAVLGRFNHCCTAL